MVKTLLPRPPPLCPVYEMFASSTSVPSNQVCIFATAICAWTWTWANAESGLVFPDSGPTTVSEEYRVEVTVD